jgi:basic membrane lipoprotein Med (substrate-binding protein (PBP1-ABC) superfamily)
MKKTPLILMSLLVLLIGILPTAVAQDGIETVCLVTDLGRVNDGTFNQFAHVGAEAAAEDFDLEYKFIETQAETDYALNINTCVEEGFEVIITVGFLIANATWDAAVANPDVYFIGVDQFVGDRTDEDGNVTEEAPPNYVGIQFREDQSGFLAGALAAMVAETLDSNTVAGVYGIAIPPVVKFRNGFEQGAKFINPDIELLGVYIDDFLAPDRGASAAEQFIGEGASVIFGAGGPTGTGGIQAAARQGVYVIGVDQDEWVTSFGEGEVEGAEFIISSAMKRVDQGVYDMVAVLAEGAYDEFPGGGNYLMDAALNGVGFAPKHDADIDDEIYERLQEIFDGLASGEIETGVDPVTGELLEETEE